MTAHDDSVYLGHMLDTSRKALDKVRNTTRAEFDDDETLRLALLYLVQTVGEAARRVSPRTRASCRAIPWENIVGMRHKLVHDYMHIDEEILWQVVTRDLPRLVEQLVALVPDQA